MEEAGGGIGDGQPQLIKAVMYAAMAGNMQMVRQMVEQCPWLLHTRDDYGNTVLQTACIRGSCDMVGYLLDQGAGINLTEDRVPLLVHALCDDNMALFKVLLERGANPLLLDSTGYNILVAASAKGKVDAVTALLKLKQVREAINTQTPSGTTALSVAAARGHSEIVWMLLEAGADPDLGECSCLDDTNPKGYSKCINILEVRA